jgi:MFS family permease
MRRLLLLVSAIVLVDTMLFAALTPLLPHYSELFGLSKAGAGLLLATYAIGVLVGGLPAGLVAARAGAKRATLAGLLVIGAASFGFAFADGVWTLGVARFTQGVGSALSWAGGLAWIVAASPRERRGELLGTALGAAIVGALLGPVLGGIASLVGTQAAFSAVGVTAAVVALAGALERGVARETLSPQAIARAFVSPRFLGGIWLMVLPALLFGVLSVLVSLDLDRLGWGALAIGAVFFVSAAIEAAVNPFIGRVSDRRGPLAPVRAALPAAVVVSLTLAWADAPALIAGLALAASVAYGTLFTPGLALLSAGAERAGLPQGLGFGIMNAGWAIGATLGPTLGGVLGEELGDPVAYGLAASACALTLAGAAAGPTVLGTRVQRVPEAP